jgi:hypothetical protein
MSSPKVMASTLKASNSNIKLNEPDGFDDEYAFPRQLIPTSMKGLFVLYLYIYICYYN